MQIRNVRFIIATLTTFGAYAVYVSRVNLSIAIIAMVNQTAQDSDLDTGPLGQDSLERPLAGLSGNGNSTFNLASAPTLGANSIFPTSEKSIKSPLISQHKFHWDQTEQGHILGAFFYGYILFQIPGARIAESVGAKWILFTGIFSSAVISLVFPLSAQLNSLNLLMLLRFIMGLSQSAFFPAAYVLFCRWLPERERSILLPIMFIGSNVGSISTYIMSSYLITSSYGWPSVFYVSGLVCLLVSLLWYVFVSSTPDDNWLISHEECQFINKNVCNQSSEINSLNEQSVGDTSSPSSSSDSLAMEKKLAHFVDFNNNNIDFENNNNNNNLLDRRASISTRRQHSSQTNNNDPLEAARQKAKDSKFATSGGKHQVLVAPEPSWNKLICSVPIWTLVFSMYGNEWSNVVICYLLPSYLNTALHFPIKQNGAINSFFQLCFAVSSPIMSSLGAYMLDNHLLGMRKIHVRKLFQSLATFGQLVCFLSVPICGSNRDLIIMFMFAAIIFKSCANAGDIMVSGDLSPGKFLPQLISSFIIYLLSTTITNNLYIRIRGNSFRLCKLHRKHGGLFCARASGRHSSRRQSSRTVDSLLAHHRRHHGLLGTYLFGFRCHPPAGVRARRGATRGVGPDRAAQGCC